MAPLTARLVALLPATAASLALLLFAIAAWNALRAGMLPALMETAANAQPMWFCH